MKLHAADIDFQAIAEEFHLQRDFSQEVVAEAEAATDQCAGMRVDATDLEFITIDPQGSMDLDQAVCIQRQQAGGYVVYYAIADVAAFVRPGSEIYAESLRRGQTIYLPDEPVRLHPPALSEDKASLLPGVDRPAVLWTIELDDRGEVLGATVNRAMVRSRRRYDYLEAQTAYEAGTADSTICLLVDVGKLRARSSQRAGAITLNMPTQEVERRGDDLFELVIEDRVPMMDYNSEISLLAGICAAEIMVNARVGVIRGLRQADDKAIAQFWREAKNLGYDVGDLELAEFLDKLNPNSPRGMVMMRQAQKLLRGAEYLNVAKEEVFSHAGVVGSAGDAYYSHVTAPLRRLVDRFATEVCLAVTSGQALPQWVTDDLEQVIATMELSSRQASAVDKACLSMCEAQVLLHWVGHSFDAVIVSTNEEQESSKVFVESPPVYADCAGSVAEGKRVPVTLTVADPVRRIVLFSA